MAENREQLFKELAKRLREEGPDANIDDLIQYGTDNLENSRQTRDLLEQYIGSELMKNTNIPIDLKNEKQAKKTLERLTEQYTDIKNPIWDIYDIKGDTVGGLHTDGTFGANKRFLDKNTAGQLIAHEPIHKMVQDEGLGKSIPDNIMTKAKEALMKEKGISPRGNQLNKLGAMAGHEIMQHGHLNPTSKMTSSLKNALGVASGDFKKLMKGVPLVGPAVVGGLTYAMTGDAEAAQNAATPGLSEADALGPDKGSLESIVEDPTKTYEQRRRAIEQLANKKGEM